MSTLVLAGFGRTVLADLQEGVALSTHAARLIATTIVAGAAYGAALGAWHGPRLAIYAAIKIPILLVGTAAITALFNWVVASLFELPMRLPQTFALSLVPLTIAAIVAASLAPVLFLFAISLPDPTPAQRTVHNVLYLLHVAVIGGAGLTGISKLHEVLLEVARGRAAVATRIRAAWVLAYAFVGGELAWALRPFVGSVYMPVVFLRDDALRGNVYEFILTNILPHLWTEVIR